jgi:hypothetical protein
MTPGELLAFSAVLLAMASAATAVTGWIHLLTFAMIITLGLAAEVILGGM